MKLLIILMLALAALVLVLMGACKVSGECSREEEKVDYCQCCVRWSECNGVDKDCPWWDGDRK